MKNTVFILMSFMAVFLTQAVVAANSLGYLPAVNSLLLSEDGATPPPLSTFDDIHPFLLRDCLGSSCHDNPSRTYRVYTEIIPS